MALDQPQDIAPRTLVVPLLDTGTGNHQDYGVSGSLVVSGGILFIYGQEVWNKVGAQ